MAAAPTPESRALEAKWWEMSLKDKGDMEGMKKLLEENPDLNVDCVDSSGMTALQNAAFRGHVDLCEYLLEKGADVNSDKHDNQYTALMFGALSGNELVVNLLLEAGAKVDAVNSVSRTAAEMAAFVAQYHITGVIKNFFPSKDLLKFTKVTGKEKRPRLKKELLKPFHALISGYNLHPIHIARTLHETPGLIEDSKYLQDILNGLVYEKMDPYRTDEPMALKLHYLSCIIDQTSKAAAKDSTGKTFLKRLATGRDSDGFLEQLENLTRSTLKSFPVRESKLYIATLQKLGSVNIGDEPTGLIVITDAINGNRMRTAEDQVCDICGCRQPKQCKKCQHAFYCAPPKTCQKLNWPTHKKFCKEPEPIVDI